VIALCNILSIFLRCVTEDQIIFTHSICDDLLTSFGINKDAQCKMDSATVMTTLIVEALFFA
jgi:hypothetical protein